MLSDEIRIRQNIPEDIYGLLVVKVEQNSEAERKGIRPGDIIQEINQVPVNKINELKKVISKSSNKKGVLLLINRQGNIIFTALKIKS
jgi:serine protease Do